jgi:zinc protease
MLAAITLLLATKCGREREAFAGTATPDATPPTAEEEIDPDSWGAAFARQIPPPTDLQRDTALADGLLANGLKYIVMEHPETAGRVSFRLLVKAGSVHEEQHERGFAHFVEHMAFRGTVHQSDGHAFDAFERLGLKAGADTNAATDNCYTYYKLDIPDADEASLTQGLAFLRDVADGILFRDTDVDAERRVVLREMDERKNSAGADLRMAAILPNVRAAQQSPIGLREDVETATSVQLRAFWQKHYVPSRMVIIATGDFVRKEMIARIVKQFVSLAGARGPAGAAGRRPASG